MPTWGNGRGGAASAGAVMGIMEEEEPQGQDVGDWLSRNRDALIQRSLALIVERSTLEELAARPLGDYIRELRARLDEEHGPAAVEAGPAVEAEDEDGGGGETFSEAAGRRERLGEELERQLSPYRGSRRPFALALVGVGEAGADAFSATPSPEAWTAALQETVGTARTVMPAGRGITAVLMPRTGPVGARAAADTLRVAAWRRLSERGPLADVGIALYPDDGDDAAAIIAAALDRLGRAWASPLDPPLEP